MKVHEEQEFLGVSLNKKQILQMRREIPYIFLSQFQKESSKEITLSAERFLSLNNQEWKSTSVVTVSTVRWKTYLLGFDSFLHNNMIFYLPHSSLLPFRNFIFPNTQHLFLQGRHAVEQTGKKMS